MDHGAFACVLVLLVNLLWPVSTNLITYAPPPCNQNETRAGGKCFLTAACDNCSHTEVKCYEKPQEAGLLFAKKTHLVAARSKYLREFRERRNEGYDIVYLDESWVNARHTFDKERQSADRQQRRIIPSKDKQLQPLYQSQFQDAFCGPHGVVVVKSKVGNLHNLLPLKCRNGSCPDGSGCLKNPNDKKLYCCSRGTEDVASRSSTDSTHTAGTNSTGDLLREYLSAIRDMRTKSSIQNSPSEEYPVTTSDWNNIVIDTLADETTPPEDLHKSDIKH